MNNRHGTRHGIGNVGGHLIGAAPAGDYSYMVANAG
jgi:hypothetical protein